jgi:hypothetical protein
MSEHRPQSESELIEYLRSIDVRAPDELRRKVQALVAEHDLPRRRSPWKRLFGAAPSLGFKLGGSAVALAALVAVLVAILAGAGAPALTLRQTQTLTLRAATMPAPTQSASDPRALAVAVDGVAFPYWNDRFGWRSTGARVDHIGGRTVTTVFYADDGGGRIGYAIVAGTPAPAISGGTIAWRDGTPFRMMRENGAQTVTWMRDGHLCVVSGRDMDSATLLRLASWDDDGIAS